MNCNNGNSTYQVAKVVKHWDQWSGDIQNLIECKCCSGSFSPSLERGLNQVTSSGPLQHKLINDSMIPIYHS